MAERCNFCSHTSGVLFQDVDQDSWWCRRCGAVCWVDLENPPVWREPENLAALRNIAQAIVANLDAIQPGERAELEIVGDLKNAGAQLCRLLGGGRNLLAEVRRG